MPLFESVRLPNPAESCQVFGALCQHLSVRQTPPDILLFYFSLPRDKEELPSKSQLNNLAVKKGGKKLVKNPQFSSGSN